MSGRDAEIEIGFQFQRDAIEAVERLSTASATFGDSFA
jgi:hypothetical protein